MRPELAVDFTEPDRSESLSFPHVISTKLTRSGHVSAQGPLGALATVRTVGGVDRRGPLSGWHRDVPGAGGRPASHWPCGAGRGACPPGRSPVPQTDGRRALRGRPATGTWPFEALHITCVSQTQKKPAVLHGFLLETMTYTKSNFSRIRIASCNLAGEQADRCPLRREGPRRPPGVGGRRTGVGPELRWVGVPAAPPAPPGCVPASPSTRRPRLTPQRTPPEGEADPVPTSHLAAVRRASPGLSF